MGPHWPRKELLVVDSMHTRKRLMAEKAEAFAILPGGVGTLDETFEILSWQQLRLHDKPVFLVDVGGFWRPLRELLDHIAEAGFAAPPVPKLLQVVEDIPVLMAKLAEAVPGHPAAQIYCKPLLLTRWRYSSFATVPKNRG